jgi:hypothetical protein
VSPELARAIHALVALLDALEQRVGTDELLPRAVVDEARAKARSSARWQPADNGNA